MTPLDTARRYLRVPSRYLTPFVIVHNDVAQVVVFGDLTTMRLRCDIFSGKISPTPYLILRFSSSQPFSPLGFMYVWTYLNGLDGDYSLYSTLIRLSYVIPIPHRTPERAPLRPVTRSVLASWPIFHAFGIKPYENIIGKWYLGLFPLPIHVDPAIHEIVAAIPTRILPPPTSVRDGPVTPNQFDTEYILRAGYPPDHLPPSFRSFAGEKIPEDDIIKRYFTDVPVHRLKQQMGTVEKLYYPVAVVIGVEAYECTFYVIAHGHEQDQSLWAIPRGPEVSDFMARYQWMLCLILQTSSSSDEISVMIVYADGQWYTLSVIDVNIALRPLQVIPSIAFHRRTVKPITKIDHVDETITQKYWAIPRVLSSAATFRFGDRTITGNPVTMLTRSQWIAIATADGDNIINSEMRIDNWDAFNIVWRWMNHGGSTFRDEVDLVITDYRVILHYLNYFSVPLTSSFVDMTFRMLLANSLAMRRLFTDATLRQLDTTVLLVPMSELETNPDIVPASHLNIVGGKIFTIPYSSYTRVGHTEVRVGDVIIWGLKAYYLREEAEGTFRSGYYVTFSIREDIITKREGDIITTDSVTEVIFLRPPVQEMAEDVE